MSKKQKQNVALRDAHISIAKMEIDKALDLLQNNVNEETKPKFMSSQKSLETHAAEIDRLSNEIILSLNPEEPEHYVKEMETSSTMQNTLSETIFKLVLSIEKYDKNEQTETVSNHSTPSTIGKPPSMKIPKIAIKPFSGDKLSYQLFKESFEAGIGAKEDMSKVEKFVYLRSLLRGKAEQLVNGLSLTGENYETALKLLGERYGDKQGLINEHTSKLIKLSKVKDVSDTIALRELYDNIECHIRNLDVLKPDCLSTLGTMLITVILEKIPEELRLLITRKFSNAEWDVRELLDEFKNEISVREKCDIKPQQNSTDKSKSHHQPSAMGLHSGSSKISCAFCKGNHYSDKCETVTDISSRKESLRRSGKCFVCFKSGHMSRNCCIIKTCFHCKEKGHNSALCEKKSLSIAGDSPNATRSNQNYATMITYATTRNSQLLLKTAEARIYGDSLNDYVTARVLFDEGSQRSYVSNRLCELLNLKTIATETLALGIFGSTLTKPRTMKKVILRLAKKSSNESIQIDALSVPYICHPITEQPIEVAKYKFPHLQNLNLADSNANNSNLEIDILVGVDHFWEFFTGEILKGPPYTPTAMRSHLGWVLSGPVSDESTTNLSHNGVTTTHAMRVDTSTPKQLDKIENQLSKFWDLESLGIDPNESTTIERMIDTLELNEENHYEVTLPFREDHPTIPDNYELCRNRLSKLHQKLTKDAEFFERYDNTFREQLEKGIIERADELGEIGAVHYLPHHPVVREDRQTTKLRVVFDASAKSQGPSLNECLYKGPQLTPLLYDILIRFRSYPVALTADIKKAFFQISITQQDRDYLRFLWFDDITAKTPSIVKYRFTRVPFGLNSSPFVLNGTLKKHTEKFVDDEDFVTKTRDSLYVDDFTGGDDDVVAATKLHSKLNTRFQSANFNFRKWRTNDPMLRSLIADKTLNCESQKILGIKWNDREDTLIFDLDEIAATTNTQQALTKRIMLRTLSSFFDPLGMLQPIIVGLKIMFQEACKFTKDWDQVLPNDIQQKWYNRINEIQELKSIKVNRTYAKIDPSDPISSHEIHGFSDASDDAYGASVYLKSIHESGNIQTSLITSKSKVTPIKLQSNPDPESTPRLELLGNLLLARLTNTVVDALKHRYEADRILYWTDSTATLSWIKTNIETKAFIENRIKEIRKRTDKNNWFHVKGENNPADIITRNTSVNDLANKTLWWNGPAELRLSLDEQMTLNINNTKLPPPQQLKKQTSTHISVVTSNPPIIIERFSCLKKLYRVTAYAMRFVNNLSAKFKPNIKCRKGVLTTNELYHAEHYWLKTAQKDLQLPKQVESFTDDDGLKRYSGRLQNAPIPLAARHPILLSSRHHLTELIILDTHQLVKHAWVKDTLTEMRQKFWLPKGRNFIRKLLFKCPTCRKHQTTPYNYPKPPPLLPLRTQDSHSFAVTGIDNFGPVNVKDIFFTRSRTYKAWATLYTCASSRAIILDLVAHPSAPDFKASLSRFISRRGCPDHIITDNGSNFTADETKLFATERNISWHLNVPLAPWYGGFFERIVKIVKTLLKKLLGTATYRFDELQTFLLEIEHIVNNRPITYMYGDEVEPCLTPNHLVFGRRLNLKSASTSNQLPTTKEPPSYNKLETTLNKFWQRWRTEYLTELREHQRRRATRKTMSPLPNVGDIVIIEEEYTPRSFWRVARIIEIHPGADGQCRSASLKLAKSGNVIKRTVNKLYPIERYEINDINDNFETNYKNDTNRTRRNAGIIADLKMKNFK